MSVIGGDFIGFTFDNTHSSDLGIIRTSDGSRYNTNLLPTVQDKTVQVPGGDGTYYFGSYYTQRPISISIAFDSLTEKQFINLSRIFGDRKVHKLIFDETPYKYYMVKATGTPQIKTICFDEDGLRIYKGEGTLQFTAYYPFAKSVYKYLDLYTNSNKSEWSESSRMAATQGTLDSVYNGVVEVYNAGDQITYPKITYALGTGGLNLNLSLGNEYLKVVIPADPNRVATTITVDMKSNLISDISGILYNRYITDGSFFGIEPMDYGTTADLTCGDCTSIEYDYIYY